MTIYSTTPEERIRELNHELSELRAERTQMQSRIVELEAQLADANKSLQAIADFQHMMFGEDGDNE